MMKFAPPDNDVKLYESAFEDDILGREKFSKALSEVLERIEDPLVVALDGRWGTGKSYFLKRWVGAHRVQNNGTALTVYFDAFAHDYTSEPLIALVGTLSKRVAAVDEQKIKRLRRAAIKFIKPAARLGLALATFGATEALNEIGDAAADAIKGEAERAVEDFWAREDGRQAAMEDFRAAIKTLTAPSGQSNVTPLIIVIDELDRCRPDYALEVLEVIKHFFAVPHVHFVLGVNLKALENSVKARYGLEIDATAYLQKFLSFTLSLPNHIGDNDRTPAPIKYIDYLGSLMAIPSHILYEIRDQIIIISKLNHLSIRDIGKIMSTAALLPDEAMANSLLPAWRAATITLIVTRVVRPDLFPKFLDASIGSEEISTYFGADENLIRETTPTGDANPDYNSRLWWLYSIWIFICRNGDMGEDESRQSISRAFQAYGHPHNINKIPLIIYEQWLSVFKLS